MLLSLKSAQEDGQHFARSIALLRLKRQRAGQPSASKSSAGAP